MVTHGGEQLSNTETAREHLWSRQRGAINITHRGRQEENSSAFGEHLLNVSGTFFIFFLHQTTVLVVRQTEFSLWIKKVVIMFW